MVVFVFVDLGRMYQLVSRIQDGLGELKMLLESHIHNQGLAAIERCGDAALNVRDGCFRWALPPAHTGRVALQHSAKISHDLHCAVLHQV